MASPSLSQKFTTLQVAWTAHSAVPDIVAEYPLLEASVPVMRRPCLVRRRRSTFSAADGLGAEMKTDKSPVCVKVAILDDFELGVAVSSGT